MKRGFEKTVDLEVLQNGRNWPSNYGWELIADILLHHEMGLINFYIPGSARFRSSTVWLLVICARNLRDSDYWPHSLVWKNSTKGSFLVARTGGEHSIPFQIKVYSLVSVYKGGNLLDLSSAVFIDLAGGLNNRLWHCKAGLAGFVGDKILQPPSSNVHDYQHAPSW